MGSVGGVGTRDEPWAGNGVVSVAGVVSGAGTIGAMLVFVSTVVSVVVSVVVPVVVAFIILESVTAPELVVVVELVVVPEFNFAKSSTTVPFDAGLVIDEFTITVCKLSQFPKSVLV